MHTVAKGKAVGRFEAALGIIGVLALGTTAILITGWNPLPQVQEWFARTGKLADPEATWVQRVGGQPTAAVVAGAAVVVTMRGAIEARGLNTGLTLWQRDADWAAVAGDESATVAVVGRRGAGLEVIEPSTGNVRWKDADAVGAWTYRDLVLTLSCGGLSDCTLAARAPSDGTRRWKSTLPGIGRVLAGVNNELLGSRELSSTYREAVAASPDPVPSLLGFPTDERVQVIDITSGKRLREEKPSATSRVVVVGGRVLVSTALPTDGGCRYSLEARDAATGKSVWKKDGYDLHTASGAGCEQRKDPPGSGNVLAATRGDNRDVFLAAHDGKELWVGQPGETAIATDGQYGVVRSADKKSIRVYDLSSGSKIWEQAAPAKSDVAITRYAVLVNDPSATNLKAYNSRSGRLVLDLKTTADVLGYGPSGLMLGRGRTIGYAPFTG